MIELRDLQVGYHPARPVLKGLNLTAGKGELLALVGRNGSGKSTLLRSVLGLQPPLKGNCFLSGRHISKYSSRERARFMAYVSSASRSSSGLRVKEVLALGRIPHSDWTGRLGREEKQLIELVAEDLGLRDFLDRPLEELSDGEKQRCMIGRALVQDSPVILLDEPAAFLDIPHKYELAGILSSLRDRGKTILYSTHDLEMAMMTADRFWVILDGSVLEGAPEDLGLQGSFDELFKDNSISFDAVSGRFRLQQTPRGSMTLTGSDDLALAWTGHALRRMGYHVSSRGVYPMLEIGGQGEDRLWKLQEQAGAGVKEFRKLYDLAYFLTQEQ